MWNTLSDEEKRRSANTAHSWSEDQLVEALGSCLYGQVVERGIAQAPWDLRQKRDRLARYLAELDEALRQVICVQLDYCKRRHDPDFVEETTLAVTIADGIFMGVTKLPFPPFILSVYLIRRGLSAFCECK